MGALGHERFAVVGHDTGFAISYALAADHPDRVARVALVEIPGPPMRLPHRPCSSPLRSTTGSGHLSFNCVEKLPEQLVAGREEIFFGYEFAIQGGKLPDDVIKYYVRLVSNPDALRGSFGFYRAFDATLAQNEKRKSKRLTMPVLAIGGEESYAGLVGDAMKLLADDVQRVVIPGAGHWVAEEASEKMLAFLAPHREAAHTLGPEGKAAR